MYTYSLPTSTKQHDMGTFNKAASSGSVKRLVCGGSSTQLLILMTSFCCYKWRLFKEGKLMASYITMYCSLP